MKRTGEVVISEQEGLIRVDSAEYDLRQDQSKGTWHTKIPRNERQFRTFSAKSPELLQRKLEKALGLSPAEMGLREDRVTVEEWYEKYEKMEEVRVVTSTQAQRKANYRRAIVPYWKEWILQDINEKDVEGWFEWLTESQVTAEGNTDWNSIRGIWSTFRGVMQRAADARYIPFNPVPKRRMPKTEGEDRRLVYNEEECLEIWEGRYDYPYGSMLALGLVTGMRRGEITGIMIRDDDPQRGILIVQRQIIMEKNEGEGKIDVYVHRTKTGRRRMIHLTDEAKSLLEELIQIRKGKEKDFLKNDPDGFLFVDSLGFRIPPKEVNEEMKRRMAYINDSAHPHALRRTFATRYYRDHGRDLAKVAAELGVTLETAMRYVVESPEGEAFVADALTRMICDDTQRERGLENDGRRNPEDSGEDLRAGQ